MNFKIFISLQIMETQKHTSVKPLSKLKIIYDDDVRIIDFIADLQCRAFVLHDLEIQVRRMGNKPACMLYNCDKDDMVVLILYNSPFDFNGCENTMIMYAERSIRGLIRYFKNQLDHTSPEVERIYDALTDITQLLYWEWVQHEENDTQTNFMG